MKKFVKKYVCLFLTFAMVLGLMIPASVKAAMNSTDIDPLALDPIVGVGTMHTASYWFTDTNQSRRSDSGSKSKNYDHADVDVRLNSGGNTVPTIFMMVVDYITPASSAVTIYGVGSNWPYYNINYRNEDETVQLMATSGSEVAGYQVNANWYPNARESGYAK